MAGYMKFIIACICSILAYESFNIHNNCKTASTDCITELNELNWFNFTWEYKPTQRRHARIQTHKHTYSL